MSEKPELLPCPFCGSTEAQPNFQEMGDGFKAWVQCGCGARGPWLWRAGAVQPAEEVAARRWNRRALAAMMVRVAGLAGANKPAAVDEEPTDKMTWDTKRYRVVETGNYELVGAVIDQWDEIGYRPILMSQVVKLGRIVTTLVFERRAENE